MVVIIFVAMLLQAYLKPFENESDNHIELAMLSLAGASALVVNSQIINKSNLAVGILLTLFGFIGIALAPILKKLLAEKK